MIFSKGENNVTKKEGIFNDRCDCRLRFLRIYASARETENRGSGRVRRGSFAERGAGKRTDQPNGFGLRD